jgi:iron complex transport system substrate-binding protein
VRHALRPAPAALLLACFSAYAVATVPADGATAGAAPGPQHVMSLSMCTDDLLLELLPPERIASVTYYARRPANSYLWPQAEHVAVNAGTAEEVLAAKPDLVLAGTYTTPATRHLLENMHYPMLEVPPANDFDEIRVVTRRVAHALNRDAAAETLIAGMDSTLRELSESKPLQTIRVAAWGEGGSIPGKGTLFDAILRAAGGTNIVPAESNRAYTSFDVEQLLMARPDVIAYPSNTSDTPGRNTDQALHPLILKLYAGRRIVYPVALFSCGIPASARAAVALRADLLAAVAVRP